MTYEDFINNLNYSSYRHNRLTFPETKPSQWAKLFKNGELLEARFQQECQAFIGKFGDTASCWQRAMGAGA